MPTSTPSVYRSPIAVLFATSQESTRIAHLITSLSRSLAASTLEPDACDPGIPVFACCTPEPAQLIQEVQGLLQHQTQRLLVVILLPPTEQQAPDFTVLRLSESLRSLQSAEVGSSQPPPLTVVHVAMDRLWRQYRDQLRGEVWMEGLNASAGSLLDLELRLLKRLLTLLTASASRNPIRVLMPDPEENSEDPTPEHVALEKTFRLTPELEVRALTRAGWSAELSQASEDQTGPALGLLLPFASADFPIWKESLLLSARARRLPILLVNLEAGAASGLPASLDSLPGCAATDANRVLSTFLRLLLRWRYFQVDAAGLLAMAQFELPVKVLARAPGLTDLALWQVPESQPLRLFHPDPPLPVTLQTLLLKAQPRLKLMTPATLFRRVLARGFLPASELLDPEGLQTRHAELSPLKGLTVALALSRTPDKEGMTGLLQAREQAILLQLARNLVSLGASLAYCGDLRTDGWVNTLVRLLEQHNRLGLAPHELLRWHRAPWESAKQPPVPVLTTPASFADALGSPGAPPPVLVPPWLQKRIDEALALSHTRWKLTQNTQARIAIGGKLKPQLGDSPTAGPHNVNPQHTREGGFQGRFPGILEEVWMSRQPNVNGIPQPVYLVGGVGGAAQRLGKRLFGDVSTDPLWPEEREAQTQRHTDFPSFCQYFDLLRGELKLPEDGRGLQDALLNERTSAQSSDDWNGLTLAENQRLVESRHPQEIAALIVRGLLRVWPRLRASAPAHVRVNLQVGSLLKARDADALLLPMTRGLSLSRLLLEVRAALSASAQTQLNKWEVDAARSGDTLLLPIEQERLDANLLLLGWLGELLEPDDSETGSTEALTRLRSWLQSWLSSMLQTAQRLGLTHLALPLPGRAFCDDSAALGRLFLEVLSAVVTGPGLPGTGAAAGTPALTLTLVVDEAEFGQLEPLWKPATEAPAHNPGVDPLRLNPEGLELGGLELKVLEPQAQASTSDAAPVLIQVTAEPAQADKQERFRVVVIPPSGAAMVRPRVIALDARFKPHLLGSVSSGRVPPIPYLVSLARDFTRQLLGLDPAGTGDSGNTLRELHKHLSRPWLLVHDAPGATLPYELLCPALAIDPAASAFDVKQLPVLNGGGLTRLFCSSPESGAPGLPVHTHKPHRARRLFRALIVVGDTHDLDQAPKELDALCAALPPGQRQLIGSVENAASLAEVIEALNEPFELMHFIGHASFNGFSSNSSGLHLAGKGRLNSAALRQVRFIPPRLVLNACESARTRGEAESDEPASWAEQAGSLAEAFLLSGVEELVGTFWKVGDNAASLFSRSLYSALLAGASLRTAVVTARRMLADSGSQEWCNYRHYGRGQWEIE